MPKYESLESFIEELPTLAAAAKDRLKGCSGAFRLEITGGRAYEIEIHPDGQATFGALSREPDCIVAASEHDLLSVIQGRLSPARALLLRKIRVRGQIARLTTLIALLD